MAACPGRVLFCCCCVEWARGFLDFISALFCFYFQENHKENCLLWVPRVPSSLRLPYLWVLFLKFPALLCPLGAPEPKCVTAHVIAGVVALALGGVGGTCPFGVGYTNRELSS